METEAHLSEGDSHEMSDNKKDKKNMKQYTVPILETLRKILQQYHLAKISIKNHGTDEQIFNILTFANDQISKFFADRCDLYKVRKPENPPLDDQEAFARLFEIIYRFIKDKHFIDICKYETWDADKIDGKVSVATLMECKQDAEEFTRDNKIFAKKLFEEYINQLSNAIENMSKPESKEITPTKKKTAAPKSPPEQKHVTIGRSNRTAKPVLDIESEEERERATDEENEVEVTPADIITSAKEKETKTPQKTKGKK